jgi:hypothetical protein
MVGQLVEKRISFTLMLVSTILNNYVAPESSDLR